MTIRHLNIFIEVYRTGNITHAAEKLFTTQPAVTRAIKELEHYYGVTLFERYNRRLSATEAGKRFYAYALHIVDSFDQMEKELRDWDELGMIRVGATVTLGATLLPRLLKEYQRRYPGIEVRAVVSNGTTLQSALADNALDIALIEGSVTGEALCAEEFAEDRLVLLLPPDSPLLARPSIKLADLWAEPLLLREQESVGRSLLNHVFALHHLPVKPMLESVSTHALVQAVHEGLGISFLPEDLVEHSIESGFIASREVEDESFQRKNYVVWHEKKHLTASARKFIELCHRISQLEHE